MRSSVGSLSYSSISLTLALATTEHGCTMYHHIDAISQSLCGLTTELTIARPPATYTEHGADYDLQCKDIGPTNTGEGL